MLDKLLNWLGMRSPDEYALLQVSPDRRVVARFDQELDPGAVEFEAGPLEPGRYVLREVHGGQYGGSAWIHDVGDPDRVDEADQEPSEDQTAPPAPSSWDDVRNSVRLSTLEAILEDDELRQAFAAASMEAVVSDLFRGESISPDVDFSFKSPWEAMAWDSYQNPEKAKRMLSFAGSSIGESIRDGIAGNGAGHDHHHHHHGDDEAAEPTDRSELDLDPRPDDDRGADFDVIGADDQEPDEAAAVAVCDGCGREFEGEDEEHARSRLNGHSASCTGEPESREKVARDLDRRREETGEPIDAQEALDELEAAGEEPADA